MNNRKQEEEMDLEEFSTGPRSEGGTGWMELHSVVLMLNWSPGEGTGSLTIFFMQIFLDLFIFSRVDRRIFYFNIQFFSIQKQYE